MRGQRDIYMCLQVLIPVVFVFVACSVRELPKPEEVKSPGSKSETQSTFFDKVTKTLKRHQDPNQSAPYVYNQATPERLTGLKVTKESQLSKPIGSASRKIEEVTEVYWENLVTKHGLYNQKRADERLIEVRNLLGENGAETIVNWTNSGVLIDEVRSLLLNMGVNAEGHVFANLTIYRKISGVDPKKEIRIEPIIFTSPNGLKLEDFNNPVELQPQGDSNLVKSVVSQFGKISIRSLTTKGEFLIQVAKDDKLGMGIVAIANSKAFGTICPTVQLVGFEENHWDFIFLSNLVSFFKIGAQKTIPLLENFEKGLLNIRKAVESSKTLIEMNVVPNILAVLNKATNNAQRQGFLLHLKNSLTLPIERRVTIRSDEMDTQKLIPMDNSESLDAFNKPEIIFQAKVMLEQVKIIHQEMKMTSSQMPGNDLEGLIKASGELSLDLDLLSEGLDYFTRDKKIKIDPPQQPTTK